MNLAKEGATQYRHSKVSASSHSVYQPAGRKLRGGIKGAMKFRMSDEIIQTVGEGLLKEYFFQVKHTHKRAQSQMYLFP